MDRLRHLRKLTIYDTKEWARKPKGIYFGFFKFGLKVNDWMGKDIWHLYYRKDIAIIRRKKPIVSKILKNIFCRKINFA